MPLPYTPDPYSLTFNEDYTYRNVRYGTAGSNGVSVALLCNVYRDPVRDPGGNAVLFPVHGGSFINNDKTAFVEQASANTGEVGSSVAKYFHNAALYGTPRHHFDVVSISPLFLSHGVAGGVGIQGVYQQGYTSSPARNVCANRGRVLDAPWSITRCMQFFARHAALNPGQGHLFPVGDMNPDKFILGPGHSMGGWASLLSCFGKQPIFAPGASGRYQAQRRVLPRGVYVIAAEVNADPRVLYNRHIRNGVEIHEADAALIRADFDRLMIEPDAAGAFGADQPTTPFCDMLSPVKAIASAPSDRIGIAVRANYFEDFLVNTNPAPPPIVLEPAFEATLDPAFGYLTIPPYDAAGHDYRQWQLLKDACDARRAGMFTGSTLKWADYSDTPDNRFLNAYRTIARAAHTWACDILDGITPTV